MAELDSKYKSLQPYAIPGHAVSECSSRLNLLACMIVITVVLMIILL